MCFTHYEQLQKRQNGLTVCPAAGKVLSPTKTENHSLCYTKDDRETLICDVSFKGKQNNFFFFLKNNCLSVLTENSVCCPYYDSVIAGLLRSRFSLSVFI